MVGIIILNYNNTQDIISCVKSVLNYTDNSIIRILVVDNGSNESVRDVVNDSLYTLSENSFASFDSIPIDNVPLPLITYLKLPKNVGYARGNNAGLQLFKKTGCVEYIMILNSDVLFTEDVVYPLRETYNKLSNVGALSPLLYKPNGDIDYCCARRNYDKLDLLLTFSYVWAKKYKERNDAKKILLHNLDLLQQDKIEVELTSGSCMLFKKSTLESIDGFDDETFLYYEESILFKKLQKLGKINYLIPSVKCIHLGGATTTTTQNSYFLKKCNFDSMFYYCRRYERMKIWQLIYIYITANVVLFRLRLGRLIRNIIRLK